MAHAPRKRRPHSRFDPDEAAANLLHACQLAYWTIEEAAAFSLGLDSQFLNVALIETHNWRELSQPKEFLRRLELIRRALVMADLVAPMRPAKFIDWARHLGLELPPELCQYAADSKKVAEAQMARNEAETEMHNTGRNRPDAIVSEPNTRRQKTWQRIALGLAVSDYGYNPNLPRSSAPRQISEHLKRVALFVSDDTIRDCLREAVEDLGYDSSERASAEDEIHSS